MWILKIVILHLCIYEIISETSLDKFNKIAGTQFLESYWESYSSFPYDGSNCYPSVLEPNFIDYSDYAIRLNQVLSDTIKIINIAFASISAE